ncbi:sugar ABC transporter substrate-binding protein [Plantactinospora mayteni]
MLGLAGVLVAASVTACIPGDEGNSSGGDSKTVEWWTINLQKSYKVYIDGLISQYESQNPAIKIKWVDVPATDMPQKFLAAVSTGNPPDAVNLTSAQLGAFRPALSDLGEFFTDEDLKAYQPSLVDALEANGVQSGIPWYHGGGLISYYRKSVVDKVGFTADKAPKTFDEALELAQQIKDKTGVYGMNLPFVFTIPSYYGIEVLSADKTKAAFNTPQTVAVLEKLKKYYDSGALAPGTTEKNWREYPQSVQNKQIAMASADFATSLVAVEENAPEVYQDLVVAPGVRSPEGKYLLNGMQTFVIPAKSDNKAAAADWLKFVTDAKNEVEFCKLVAIFPGTVDSLNDPFFTGSKSGAPTDVARRLVASSVSDVIDVTYGTEHDVELQEALEEQIRAVLSGAKTAKQALDAAEAAWNETLG